MSFLFYLFFLQYLGTMSFIVLYFLSSSRFDFVISESRLILMSSVIRPPLIPVQSSLFVIKKYYFPLSSRCYFWPNCFNIVTSVSPSHFHPLSSSPHSCPVLVLVVTFALLRVTSLDLSRHFTASRLRQVPGFVSDDLVILPHAS